MSLSDKNVQQYAIEKAHLWFSRQAIAYINTDNIHRGDAELAEKSLFLI